MNVHEFESKTTGEVKPVSISDQTTLNEVKAWMGAYIGSRSAKTWNVLRDEVSRRFGNRILDELDASGFVSEWITSKSK